MIRGSLYMDFCFYLNSIFRCEILYYLKSEFFLMWQLISEFLINYGYLWFGVACFLAWTFFPFSSESVMVALLLTTKMDVRMVIIYWTIWNVLWSVVNYLLWRCLSQERIAKIFKIKKSRMHKAEVYVQKYWALMWFFSFIPLLWTAISIVLWILKAPFWKVCISTFLGKFLRYVVIGYIILYFS